MNVRRWLYAGGTRQDRLRDPDAVIERLEVRPGMVVGDLGPGAGHFTVRLARAVEPDGIVYALDASESTLDDLRHAADERGITTLRPVLVRRDRLEVPEPVDLLFVSATYHHLPAPSTYFAEARALLRPRGRVAILESRREGLLARWRGRHATSPRRLLREMVAAGYRLIATHEVVRGYWFGVFEVAGHEAGALEACGSIEVPVGDEPSDAIRQLFGGSRPSRARRHFPERETRQPRIR